MKQSKTVMRALTLMVMALLSAAAFAQTAEDFVCILNEAGDAAAIVEYRGKAAQLQIPAQIEGIPITEISWGAFSKNQTLTAVIIPEGVLVIQGSDEWRVPGVFSNCPKLASVTLPATLKKIGPGAFSGCESLGAITIPAGVTEIGWGAFSGCKKLSALTIPGGSIGRQAFSGCTALRSLTVAEGVSAIGGEAFSGCTALASVKLGEGLESIGILAFSKCTALKEIRLPSTIKTIDVEAFSGCSSLAAVLIPDTVTALKISGSAFSGCPLNLANQAVLRKYGYTR
jgi:hypothetical protein